MSTVKAKSKSTSAKSRADRPATPLPPSCLGLLNRMQVCEALGRISTRKLDEMISAGEFPRANARVGRSPRWSVAMINQWVHDLTPDGEPEDA